MHGKDRWQSICNTVQKIAVSRSGNLTMKGMKAMKGGQRPVAVLAGSSTTWPVSDTQNTDLYACIALRISPSKAYIPPDEFTQEAKLYNTGMTRAMFGNATKHPR